MEKFKTKIHNLRSNPRALALITAVIFGFAGVSYLLFTQAAAPSGPIVGIGSKCLDNYANLKRENNKIQLYTCNETDAQVWSVNDKRQIVNANGYCLAAEGRAERSLVTLNRCKGSDLQKWIVNSLTNTIVNAASGLCLDDQWANTDDGNPVWMYKCNGTAAQVWKPTTATAPAPTITTFTATPISITTGQSSQLNWASENTTTCSVTPGGPTNTVVTSWTTPAQTTTGTKTFTLACKNATGTTITKTVTVNVTAAIAPTPPPTVTRFDVGMSYGGNADPAPHESAWGAKVETRRTYFGPADQTKAANTIKADIAAGRKTSAISFKLPASWADMAAGKQDTWAKNLANTLVAANVSGHTIRVAFHHEPENDTGTNNGSTTAGRDAWKNMQARLSPIFDKPGLQYVAILMGYHTFYGSTSMKALWSLEASIPTNAKIKGIGFDIYQKYGVDGNTSWTDMNAYFTKIGAFTRTHGMTWGLSETGVSATAFALRPTYFTDTIAQMKAQGGTWLEYFNSDLNSPDPKWSFKVGDARDKAFGAALRAERAN